MVDSDLKIRTKDYALSVIRLFAELPKRNEAEIMGDNCFGPERRLVSRKRHDVHVDVSRFLKTSKLASDS